jgi:hypothetical protein
MMTGQQNTAPSDRSGIGFPPLDPSAPDLPTEGTTGLAEPSSGLDRVLQTIPRALSSKAHILLLVCLGVYLIVLPLLGVTVSAQAELIGGNYTNVTSDVGACIAAGGTLHLVRQGRRRHRLETERLRLAQETHRLLMHVHAQAARELDLGRPE